MKTVRNQLVEISKLLSNYSLQLVKCKGSIEGSYWGENEAGLVGGRLVVRNDTPLHSALHEACHYICMDDERRATLHTDAGGTDLEENAVCYLQIVLAGQLSGYGREQMMSEMDEWGYSFRLGSAKAWFENDAEDAQEFLREHGLIDPNDNPIIGALRR